MNTAYDDPGAGREPRLTEHQRRADFLKALAAAIEGGLPAPHTVGFHGAGVRLVMDQAATADVHDWAAQMHRPVFYKPLGVGGTVCTTPEDEPPVWAGYELRVWCVASDITGGTR